MLSARSKKLDQITRDLVNDEAQAQLLLKAIYNEITTAAEVTVDATAVTKAMLDATRDELAAIQAKGDQVFRAKNRHNDLPGGSLVLVYGTGDGEQYVIERRDENYSDPSGTWYRVDRHLDGGMSFDEAIGSGEWMKLYDANQVDDLLDRYDVHPLADLRIL